MELVSGHDGTYRCPSCEKRTHEKIENIRGDLEDLAESDNAAAWIAEALAEGVEE